MNNNILNYVIVGIERMAKIFERFARIGKLSIHYYYL